jgi:hypothetical protein
MVAEAVVVEPVSSPVFPANREKNREFSKIAQFRAPETANNAAVAWLPVRIPYSSEQGIILAEQGIVAPEPGFLSAGTEIIVE